MVGDRILQITHSHMKSFGLYKKIHGKIGIDQGLGGASLQATLTADLFLFLQVPWILQKMKRYEGGREKEKKEKQKTIQ